MSGKGNGKATANRTPIEALREIRCRLVYLYGRLDGTFDPPALKEVCEIADDALSAPPRNCDRFGVSNNTQIDNADYYRLPCGRYLEDFIFSRTLSFAEGSALKYLWRAGKKDGESAEKDRAKAEHYIKFICRHSPCGASRVREVLREMVIEAAVWDGDMGACE